MRKYITESFFKMSHHPYSVVSYCLVANESFWPFSLALLNMLVVPNICFNIGKFQNFYNVNYFDNLLYSFICVQFQIFLNASFILFNSTYAFFAAKMFHKPPAPFLGFTYYILSFLLLLHIFS